MMHVTRRGFVRSVAAVSTSFVCQSWAFSSTSTATTAVAPAGRDFRRDAARLDVEMLLDEAGFSGKMSKLETSSPYPDDSRVWERLLVNAMVEVVRPAAVQPDGAKVSRVTPDPLALLTAPEGLLVARVRLAPTGDNPQAGIWFGNREPGMTTAARTLAIATFGHVVNLLVYEDEVQPESVRHRQEVGRVGGLTNDGEVVWADTYRSELPLHDPTKPSIVAAYAKNAEASVGTVILYQPKMS